MSPPEILPDGSLTLSLAINPVADDVVGTLEISTDLQTWRPAAPQLQPSGRSAVVDGFSVLRFSGQLVPSPANWFLRYRVALRE